MAEPGEVGGWPWTSERPGMWFSGYGDAPDKNAERFCPTAGGSHGVAGSIDVTATIFIPSATTT